MPVLNKFKSILGQIFGSQPAGGFDKNDRRYLKRFFINDPDLCHLSHSEKGKFKVIDISYQSARVEGVAGATFSGVQLPTTVNLVACGRSLTFSVSKVHQREQSWIVHFEHRQEGSIQNMGVFVEPIHCGNTAVSMPTDPSKTLSPGMTRVRYFGDGPFDILIEKNNKGEITFLMGTIRRGSEYGSVTWSNGHLHTSKNIDPEGVAARMGQTREIDQQLVWTCAMACLGLNFPEGPACAKTLVSSLG